MKVLFNFVTITDYFIQGSVERQVLVEDYDAGKALAFDRRIQNLKEVYTSEGRRM